MRTAADIKTPDGKSIRRKDAIIYLGSLLDANGQAGPELNRRLGAARADFLALQTPWAHSTLSRHRKLAVFSSCVLSKLMYCVFTMTLRAVEQARLDAFQAWCLRKITRIPHSFYSRISNTTVLNICGHSPLSMQVKQQQMIYMGKIARQAASNPLRQSIFLNEGLDIRKPIGKLRRGRPRQRWGPSVMNNCLEVAGSTVRLAELFRPKRGADVAWQSAVRAVY